MMIAAYLPASVNDLRKELERMDPKGDYSNLGTVTECLIVLAKFKGYTVK